MNKVITTVAEMFIDEHGILQIKILPNAQITIESVRAYFSATLEMLSGKKALILFDGSENYFITEEAKRFGSSQEVTDTRIAIAYVTNSISNKLIFNLYMNIYKPSVPSKMFSSKKAGLEWLKKFYIMPGEKYILNKKK